MKDTFEDQGRMLRRLVLSVLLTIAGYLSFSIWVGWEDVSQALSMLSIGGLLILLALSLLNYFLRYIRWHIYLTRMGYNIPHRANLRIYLSGFALTTTPGKAGETFRGVFLKPLGVRFQTSIAAFFSERLSDLLAILLLTLIGLSHAPFGHWVVIFGGAIFLFICILLANHTLLKKIAECVDSRKSRTTRLIAHLIGILQQARACHSPMLLCLATVLSVIAWGAEALAFFWLLEWMGAPTDLTYAIFVYAFSMLAGALSFMPGGLGGSEAAMVSLLVLDGHPLTLAVAATVLIRLTTLWFAVLIGLICMYASNNRSSIR